MNREEILRILIDWNYWGNYTDESIKRPFYLERLKRLSATKEIVVIKGVRRSGKSVIIAQFIKTFIEKDKNFLPKNTLIVNFEDPRFKNLNLESLNKIYEVYLDEALPDKNHYVVLDEVQEIDGWEKFARFLSEARKVQVFITGSSSKLLSGEYATLLSGRHVDLEVFPLSFREFLEFNGLFIKNNIEKLKLRHKIKNLLKTYIEFGGFPKIALVKEREKGVILEGYFRDILLKDVQKRFKIRETAKLEELAKYFLTNISTIQSFNKIKNIIGLSLDSVERFSSYLSIAALFFFIPKFSFSSKEQMLNPKKIYCIDTGLRNIVSFRFSQDLGRLMENIVLVELKRRGLEVYYWKSSKQREVDFVIKKDKEIYEAIQVSQDLSKPETKEREITSLLQAKNELKVDKLTIITEDEEGEEVVKESKIKKVSLWSWLLNH